MPGVAEDAEVVAAFLLVVLAGGAEGFEAADFGLAVVGFEDEVHALLVRLGIGGPLENVTPSSRWSTSTNGGGALRRGNRHGWDLSRLVGHSGTTVTELVYRHQLKPVIQTGATVMGAHHLPMTVRPGGSRLTGIVQST